MRAVFKVLISMLLFCPLISVEAQGKELPTNLFFVMYSSSGSLVAQHDSGHHYILTLNNVPVDITYFSDQPINRVGSILLNTLTIAASKRTNSHFAGALSFRKQGSKKSTLMTMIINVEHYVFLANKDQLVAQVTLANAAVSANDYDLKDILLQTNGMWYLPHLFEDASKRSAA